MRKFLYSGRRVSNSCRDVSHLSGIRRIRRVNSRYRSTIGDIIFNWGSSHIDVDTHNSLVINKPSSVYNAINKINTLSILTQSGVNCLDYTTSKQTAIDALQDGQTIVCRHQVSSHSGRGIEIVKADEGVDLPDCPLYTLYKRKHSEWRVHIGVDGSIIDIQRKIRDPNKEVTNWHVRNHSNGFMFVRGSTYPCPDAVLEVALDARNALDLDFCAVDVLWDITETGAFVIEVNTAPGLTGITLEKYSNMLKGL